MLVRLLDLLWLRWWWRRHGTGNFRDCQGYWSACAPRLCRCRSWAHDQCLGSDWQRSQTFHSSERRHRGFEAGHVGEDSRTGGKRTNGTFNNDMASEMEMSVDEHVTNSLSPWANAVCPHCKSAVLYELCTARGVYTTRRTHGCCCWLSAKLRCSNFFFKKKNTGTRRGMRADSQVIGDNVELVVLSRVAPVAYMLLRLVWKREFEVVSLTIVLTIYRPANCAGAIFASSKSMKMNSTMMISVTSWMRMADDCLLRSVLPKLCSATRGTFAVKDQSCYVSVFLSLIGIKVAGCYPFSYCRFFNCSFASLYLGLCDRGGACLFSSTLRKQSMCIFLCLCCCDALW